MNMLKFSRLQKKTLGENTKRLVEELNYCAQVIASNHLSDVTFDKVVNDALVLLDKKESLSLQEVMGLEDELKEYQEDIKKNEIIAVAHAHMDINWEWGFDETVSMVTSTIETMLSLMDEYKEFTFGQSTGLVYDILSHYRPDLLERVKQRIKEGRFEVIAPTYVEEDKNLANGESQIGQLVLTKTHLADLLNIKKETLDLDFEPDTFGHSEFTPEILNAGGVKYLYHCRGTKMEGFYHWTSKNGSRILAYRDPLWYHGPIKEGVFDFAPSFFAKTKYQKILFIYGVGDHGGGASRRDIENIIKYSKYPLFPNIHFGSYHEYFAYGETLKDLPEVKEEQDQIYTGCYSTNNDIKVGNEKVETLIHETGVLTSLYSDEPVSLDEGKYPCYLNQFHDILPGSAVEESYKFAQGKYQEATAFLNAKKEVCLKSFAKNLDTLKLIQDTKVSGSDTSFGAGVGYSGNNLSASSILSNGPERLFAIFNPSNFDRHEVIRLPIWDYEDKLDSLVVEDDKKNQLAFTLVNKVPEEFYRHYHNDFLVEVNIKAFSYLTLHFYQKPTLEKPLLKGFDEPRYEEAHHDYVLENEYVKATLAKDNYRLISLLNKETNQETIKSPSGFYLATEDETRGMTSWYVENYRNINKADLNAHLEEINLNGLIQSLTYSFTYLNSKYLVTISLAKDDKKLKYHVHTYFGEKGSHENGVANFQYRLFSKKEFNKVICDVPLGVKERDVKDLDTPCTSYMFNKEVGIYGKGKHGFRAYDNTISLCLLRASFIPGIDSDYGPHDIDFAIGINDKNTDLEQESLQFRHPLVAISLGAHKGNQELRGTKLEIKGDVSVVSMEKKQEGILLGIKNKKETAQIVKFGSMVKDLKVCNAFGEISQKLVNDNSINLAPYELTYIIFKI
jgi:alpha-mannosidase